MKRVLSAASFALAAITLFGCPIYSESNVYRVCLQNGVCYACEGPEYSSACLPPSCSSAADCPSGYACSSRQCVAPAGDCSQTPCPSGTQCTLSGGVLQCLPTSPSPTDAGTADAATDSGPLGQPMECANDTACIQKTAGARCLNGRCVAPADLCSDGTQCPAASQCVQGACTPSCSAATACPTGYQCDTSKGICSINPSRCTTSASCGAGLVCVQEHCVAPCAAPQGTCASGQVCVAGGCVPDQRPRFQCGADGQSPDCATGSICLHHSCYIACGGDAGDDGGACRSADTFNVCKSVTTASGSYSVCGSDKNLGGECDPTRGTSCGSPLICIDGYCR